MSRPPAVVLGVPLYNNAPHLRQALESLLVQTHRDYAIVLVDDGSTDATGDIARQYAGLDPRVTYERNDRRLGMVENWRRAYELAEQRHPGFEYFAWGSDHDVWHPRWVEALAAELDAHPEAVLAYPRNDSLTDDGVLDRTPWSFDTRGVADVGERLELAVRGMSAGAMVYGLMRADAVRRCGVFRRVLLPDRLLLTELALLGEFRQVPAVLWTRRLREGPVQLVARQRKAFFPDRRPPLHSYLPWFVVHGAVVGWSLVAGQGRPSGLGRLRAARLATRHLRLAAALEGLRQAHRARRRVRKLAVPLLRPMRKGLAHESAAGMETEVPPVRRKEPKSTSAKGSARTKPRKQPKDGAKRAAPVAAAKKQR